MSESQIRRGGRHSEEWHHSLFKLKDKNASSKYLKKSFKILYFFVCFLSFSLSHCVSSFNPPPTVWWWGGGKRPRVSLWCLAAPYTLCILDILLMCVCIYVKCQIGCVQAQVWLCVCWFGCGSITPQRSRRSPPQPSAVSRKVSRKTHREGCLSD